MTRLRLASLFPLSVCLLSLHTTHSQSVNQNQYYRSNTQSQYQNQQPNPYPSQSQYVNEFPSWTAPSNQDLNSQYRYLYPSNNQRPSIYRNPGQSVAQNRNYQPSKTFVVQPLEIPPPLTQSQPSFTTRRPSYGPVYRPTFTPAIRPTAQRPIFQRPIVQQQIPIYEDDGVKGRKGVFGGRRIGVGGSGLQIPSRRRTVVRNNAGEAFAEEFESRSLDPEEDELSAQPHPPSQPAPGSYPQECYLHSYAGTCFAVLPRYAFNYKTGACEPFSYSGCGGNGNNFATEEACLQRCSP